MSTKDDMLGGLVMIAMLHPIAHVKKAHGYWIVSFEGTSATWMMETNKVTREEIDEIIRTTKS